MLIQLRNFLFKMMFGIRLHDFILGNVQAASLRKEVDELRNEMEAVKEIIVEVIGLTGGKGFPEITMNAIANLDARIGALTEGFKSHHETLQILSTDYIHVGSLVDPSQIKHSGN